MFFAAPARGPALGGLLIGQFGRRPVFVINLPVGLAALAGTRIVARPERGTRLGLTGSAVGAWHDCALVLAAMSVLGALAATALGTGRVTRVLVRR